MHSLRQFGTIEFERQVAVRAEFEFFAFHQGVFSVEHQAGWNVEIRAKTFPVHAVDLALCRSVHDLKLARRWDAAMADATAEETETWMLVVDDAFVLVAPVPCGNCFRL